MCAGIPRPITNNAAQMDYPRYRRAGLPTCSGLVESLVKQFNRRVKGTEKFWDPSQAETILQLPRGLPPRRRAADQAHEDPPDQRLPYV